MNSVTHILGGLALTSLLCLHTEILDPMEVGAAAMGVIGSLLPDIDHPKSKISNTTLTTKLASFAISSTTRHRGKRSMWSGRSACGLSDRRLCDVALSRNVLSSTVGFP